MLGSHRNHHSRKVFDATCGFFEKHSTKGTYLGLQIAKKWHPRMGYEQLARYKRGFIS